MKIPLHKAYISQGKRAFVYWYTMEAGERKRKITHGYVNREKDPLKRTQLLLELREQTQTLLNSGIHDIHHNYTAQFLGKQTISELLHKVMKDKKAFQSGSSSNSHNSHLRKFLAYLVERNMHRVAPQMIKQSTITDFRTWLITQKQNSNRTVNNHIVDISAFFTWLLGNIEDYNHKNPCLGLIKLRTRSETHIRYTQKQAEDIRDWLKANDPMLHLFCQVICYTFLRPNEIRLLKINQLDLQQGLITRTAQNHKTGKRKMQILQQIFRSTIDKMKLNKLDPEFYLFGNNHQPGKLFFNKDYFTRRFKKCKTALGFSNKHTMYGLKHTFICHLKQNGASDKELMGVTGHETIEALHKYLREIGAEQVKDLSSLYTFEF